MQRRAARRTAGPVPATAAGWLAAGLTSLALCPAVAADPEPAAAGAEAPPPVSLDRLLRLPDSYDVHYEDPRRGGATRQEWLARFSEARAELGAARESLDTAQQDLEKAAAGVSQWQVAAPGQSAPTEASPVSYKLSQQIRRAREQVERSEHRLQELVVEANLAGVPEGWRR